MALSRQVVEYVAKLSALSLDNDEIETMQRELGDTLEFVAQLEGVSIEGVEPTSHVHGAINAFRDDVTKPSLSVEEVGRLAPDFGSGGYRVPKII